MLSNITMIAMIAAVVNLFVLYTLVRLFKFETKSFSQAFIVVGIGFAIDMLWSSFVPKNPLNLGGFLWSLAIIFLIKRLYNVDWKDSAKVWSILYLVRVVAGAMTALALLGLLFGISMSAADFKSAADTTPAVDTTPTVDITPPPDTTSPPDTTPAVDITPPPDTTPPADETPDADPCANVVCKYANRKCVDGECVWVTCDEINGEFCESGETCDGQINPLKVGTELLDCCVGTCVTDQTDVSESCSELNGKICSDKSVCIVNKDYDAQVEFIEAGDTQYCCPLSTNCAEGDLSISGPLSVQEVLEEKRILATVTNTLSTGHQSIHLTNIKFKIYYDGQLKNEDFIRADTSAPLVPAGTNTRRFVFCNGCPEELVGHTIKIEIDTDDKVKETNENNNEYSEVIS